MRANSFSDKKMACLVIAVLKIITLANSILLAWYVIFLYKGLIHSDSAVKVLLGNEIFRTGQFFPSEWNYVNGDLFILFGQALIAPMLWFMKPGFAVHAISGIITSLVLGGAFYLLVKQQASSRYAPWLALAFITAGLSGFSAENLYGQTAYGVILTLSCIVGFLSCSILKSNVVPFGKATALFLILIFASWSNPLRAVVSYFFPIGAAVIYYALYARREMLIDKAKTVYGLLILFFLSLVIGYLLHAYTINQVNNIAGVSSARWLNYEEIGRNFSLIAKGILAIFGALPANEPIFSVAGIAVGLKITVLAGLIFILPTVFRDLLSNKKSENKIFVIYAMSAGGLAIFIQLFTSVPDMIDPIQSSRYLVPSIFLIIALVIVWATEGQRSLKKYVVNGLILILALSGVQAYTKQGLSSEPNSFAPQIIIQRQELVNFLQQNNLHYGYAGYWSAGVISVLSDGDVRIRQVNLVEGLPMPMRHLSSDDWYRKGAWRGRTFILLTEAETNLLSFQKLEAAGAKIVDKLSFHGYNIFVFDENIALYFSGWNIK